ncbi:MAG TPA: RidA family protein [Candidatus Dormibacteraeota bacterium]
MSHKQIVQSDRLNKPTGVFSQAVLVPAGRQLIFISGLVSKDQSGEVVEPGEAGPQTRQILENMTALLAEVGASLDDLVKVTIFVTDIGDFAAINDVRREFFHGDPPASTMVEVAALIDKRLVIEIEAVALVPGSAAG